MAYAKPRWRRGVERRHGEDRGRRARTFAAIDLGTNNCRLLIARPSGNSFRVIDSLRSIKVPTLVICGDGDKPFVGGARYMGDRIPGATYVEVPGAGHGVNVERPDAVNTALETFLRAI